MSAFTDAVLANAEAMRKAQEKISRREARIPELEEMCRRMVAQVDVLTEDRIQRNARIEALTAALRELLAVAERMRGGDPSLGSEEWYAIRDFARRTLATSEQARTEQAEREEAARDEGMPA
jgi:hypothetical protein